MWLLVMFDVPVKTATNKRDYARFRKTLIKTGFTRLQYSVYARHCVDERKTEKYKRVLRDIIPAEGHVRFMLLTDHQFGRAENYYGKMLQEVEEPLPQLLLF